MTRTQSNDANAPALRELIARGDHAGIAGVARPGLANSRMRPTDACPCGSGEPLGRCCLVLHRGERQAATAEQLMRARYSAYAVGDLDYIWQTWHPRTRPAR